MTTVFVARTTDIPPSNMLVVEISKQKILLVRTLDGQLRAFSPTCPHAGAPLEKGALCGARLICPWHKSCFEASDGTLLEPPALASLRSYYLEIVGEEIRVDLERSTQNMQEPHPTEISSRSQQTFVILGGGAAAAAAVQELRFLGFAGRLVMVSEEMRRPYDRTLLSKMYLSGDAESKQLPLRPETLFSDCQVEFLVAEIHSVDARNRSIDFQNGISSLHYDEVLVATGGKPNPIPGLEPHPLLLRTVEDADRLIMKAKQAENALLIGASFISMEIASAFRERGLNVTVVSHDKIPLVEHLGPEMGQLLLEKHLQKGVRFLPETKVSSIKTIGPGFTVELESGQEVAAGLVVSGIGITPATAFLKDVPRNADRSLSVDAFMRVLGVKHMFAAGDLVNFPLPNTGRRTRIEHWRVAQEQGRIAAANMMGLEKSYQGVPYFWTYHYGIRYEFFGQIPERSELSIHGNVNEPRFVTAYLDNGRCEAIFAANRESATARIFDHMKHQGSPSVEVLEQLLNLDS